jgi:hypothetical protein
VQLDSEVAVIQCREEIAVSGIVHHQRDVIANESRVTDGPPGCTPIDRKQTFSRGDVTPIAHYEIYPPDNACMTSIIELAATGSLKLSRSRTNSPSMKTTMC